MKPNDSIEAITRTLLYEGYLLYPYRPSNIKNRQRWNFGVLYPPGFCEIQLGERSSLQSECLLEASPGSILDVTLRFLHHDGSQTVEREVKLFQHRIEDLGKNTASTSFSFAELKGTFMAGSQRLADSLYKIGIQTENHSLYRGVDRDAALASSMISTHLLLRVHSGRFISLTSPPESLLSYAAECKNVGVWPVLVGEETKQDSILASPIILSDFPQIAPQSPGDFFDGTEIDEMLSLRILTLTDAEKAEMRSADPRTRQLLERTESMLEQQLSALHGTANFRAVPNCSFKPGDRVVLRPKGRADIFDLALDGKAATILSIECDYEEQTYVCVTVDDDPGRDLGAEAKPGHRFFFRLEEVELI